jgi:hypothetical protein
MIKYSTVVKESSISQTTGGAGQSSSSNSGGNQAAGSGTGGNGRTTGTAGTGVGGDPSSDGIMLIEGSLPITVEEDRRSSCHICAVYDWYLYGVCKAKKGRRKWVP